jgi:L-lactate dehydrogenase complex protein LldE
MKVQLFVPCFIDQLFPQVAFNCVKLLEKAGCEVHYNANQTCCGQPAYNAGYWEQGRPIVEKFITDFDTVEYIVSPGGSCVGFIRNHYSDLLTDDLHANHAPTQRIYELTEFLTEVLHFYDFGSTFNAVATYHDACGALRECGIKEGPRKILAHVKGLQIMEAADCEVCCGFGGTFSIKYPAISTAMAEQKVIHALEYGVQYIISTDSSCLMQLDGYIKKNNIAIQTMHIVDVLTRGW